MRCALALSVCTFACGGGSSTPFTLASGQITTTLSVDATHAYWPIVNTSGSGGSIMQAALSGGSPSTLADSQGASYAIAAAGGNVYWSAYNFPNLDGGVRAVPAAGGTPVTVAADQDFLGLQLAVDSSNAYWTVSGSPTGIASAPTRGGATTILTQGANMTPIASDGAFLYFAGPAGDLRRVPISGGTPSVVANVSTGALALAVDSTNLYWIASDGPQASTGSIVQMPAGGGALITLSSAVASPSALAIDSSHVYWVTSTAIQRVAIGGGTPQTLAQASPVAVVPSGLAVNDSYVCWVNQDSAGTSIMGLRKP